MFVFGMREKKTAYKSIFVYLTGCWLIRNRIFFLFCYFFPPPYFKLKHLSASLFGNIEMNLNTSKQYSTLFWLWNVGVEWKGNKKFQSVESWYCLPNQNKKKEKRQNLLFFSFECWIYVHQSVGFIYIFVACHGTIHYSHIWLPLLALVEIML